jgi:N-acetylglucosaminyldiphosphoundecaprenol N-acetyl-beta-D-mannosaminyltransferase
MCVRRKIAPRAPANNFHERRRSAYRNYREVMVGGLRTACVSREQMTKLMVGDCLAARQFPRSPKLVFAANGHAISMAVTNSAFRRSFRQATIVHADGQPVVFASRLLTRSPIPERSATTDFIYDAAGAARDAGLRFFLLGGSEDVNARCAEELVRRYPGLVIAGRRNGYFAADDEAAICEAINSAKADVVWVGLGVPFEYDFCARNKARLKAGWIVTSGGCFNFVSGDYARAPRWMQRAGLEWLYRLAREPKRLFWRYAITNPLALFTILIRTASYRS